MDFSKIKAKAFQFKDKVVEFTDKTIVEAAKKVSQSNIVLKNQVELDEFILKSENKTYTNDLWESKVFTKRCLVIFWDSTKDFFREFLFLLPVLLTKWFSQNLSIKLIDINNKEIEYSKYDLKEIPSMIVFENKIIYKIIIWEENIKKVVKSLSLDINKSIEEI